MLMLSSGVFAYGRIPPQSPAAQGLLRRLVPEVNSQRDLASKGRLGRLNGITIRKVNMTASARSLTKRPAWEALAVHHNKVKGLHLRDLFSADHKRGERLTAEATGLFLDYSKNRVTDETLKLLVQLAEESALHECINAMFRGGED